MNGHRRTGSALVIAVVLLTGLMMMTYAFAGFETSMTRRSELSAT